VPLAEFVFIFKKKKKAKHNKKTFISCFAAAAPRIEALTHQILGAHHSPGLWFLVQAVTKENHLTVSGEWQGLAAKRALRRWAF